MVHEMECKLDHVVDRYGLDDADPRYESIHNGLLARWKGTEAMEAKGYRTLTEWFNKRLLRRVFDRHGRDSLGGRVDNDYEALAGDDDLLRQEVIESMAADGIDGERVQTDLISWGTMRNHLLNCLDGEKTDSAAATDWERDSIDKATAFAGEKIDAAVTSLASKEQLVGADRSEVEVTVQLRCETCPATVPLDVALDQGYVCERHHLDTDSESADTANERPRT